MPKIQMYYFIIDTIDGCGPWFKDAAGRRELEIILSCLEHISMGYKLLEKQVSTALQTSPKVLEGFVWRGWLKTGYTLWCQQVIFENS